MEQENISLLTDLHVQQHRQGPGSDAVFYRALELSGIDIHAPLTIADIGCGTGASSILLAQHTNAHITAVDLLPDFLKKLEQNARDAGVNDRITTLDADMNDLPFEKEQYDVIWSEGAIYNIGFKKGIDAWKQYLKPNGILVVTEITWLTPNVPAQLREHWTSEYPDIACASTKLHQLEQSGYKPFGYFILPYECWVKNYYDPLQAVFSDFLDRHDHNNHARSIVASEQKEIALYEKYHAYYSYGCYIAQKL